MFSIRTVTAILILCFFVGCSDEHSDSTFLNIHIALAPESGQQAEITRIIITVSGPGMAQQDFELNFEGRKAIGMIAVPAGENRLFIVRAYSGDDVEFEGESLVEYLGPQTIVNLELRLEPAKLTIKIIPPEIKVSAGSVFEADIAIERAKELFACSFEVEYDKNLLEPIEVTLGDFLGNDVLFLSRVDPGKISIGATRKAGTVGVKGSGSIARVKFRAITSGETVVKFAKNDEFTLRKENDMNIDGFNEIIIQQAKITIN